MLLLVRYAKSGDPCTTLEAHTLLRNHSIPFSVEKAAFPGDPFEIIVATLEAADLLCAKCIWVKSVSVLLNFGTRKEIHFVNSSYAKRYSLKSTRLRDFLALLHCIPDFSFARPEFFIRSHFYGDKKKIRHEEVVEEFEYVLETVSTTGTALEIDVAGHFYASLSYKDSLRKHWKKFGVKSLPFIGRTSMNVEDVVFMTNLCDIREDMVVYDPCVGSGSLLLIPALRKARVLGSDVDPREMIGTFEHRTNCRTKLKGTDINSNFAKFGVDHRVLGAMVADIAREPVLKVDRVVADIPYGRRVSLAKGSPESFVSRVALLARKVLGRGGVLGLWTPGPQSTEIAGMVLVCHYVQDTFSFQRSLSVYRRS